MMTLIGLPRTLPPKSSTAICAAVTEPWPVGVEAGPFMSVSTPILTTSSESCASASDKGSSTAASAARIDKRMIESKPSSRGTIAAAPFLDRLRSRTPHVQSIGAGRQSGGEPDLTGGGRVVAAELAGALRQPPVAEEAHQRLHRGPEIAALARQEIEAFPGQRDKIEPRNLCSRARSNAAIGAAVADRRGKVRSRQAGRLEPLQVLQRCAGMRQQCLEQKLGTGAWLAYRHGGPRAERVGDVLQIFRIAHREQHALLSPGKSDQQGVVKAGQGTDSRDVDIADSTRAVVELVDAVEMHGSGDHFATLQPVDAARRAFIQRGQPGTRFLQRPVQQIVLAATDDRGRLRWLHASRPGHAGHHPEVQFVAREYAFTGAFAAGNR